MTISLAAVFLPVFFMSGIMGRLLHEFAVVIITSILVSGVVSLTLTPMLCSRFLRPAGEMKHGRVYMALERFLDWMLKVYDVSLQMVLAPPGFRDGRVRNYFNYNRVAVCGDSQRIFACGRQIADIRLYGSVSGYFFRIHEAASAAN